MSEFNAVANLEVVPTGMGAARREIENELGDIEAGVTANRPTGRAIADGGAAGIGQGQAAGILDASQKSFGALETLVDLDEERNELLDELIDQFGDVGEGGGGGGAGQTLLQVAGAQSVLGGAAGGGILASLLGGGATAGAAVGLPLLGGLAGQEGAEQLDRLFPGHRGETGIAGTQFTEEELAGDVEPVLQVPDPWPPKLEIPGQFPSIGVDAPRWLQGVAEGLGIDISVSTDNTITVSDETRNAERQRFEVAAEQRQQEILREAESIARAEVQRFEQRLKRELGSGTGTRTGGGTSGARTR